MTIPCPGCGASQAFDQTAPGARWSPDDHCVTVSEPMSGAIHLLVTCPAQQYQIAILVKP